MHTLNKTVNIETGLFEQFNETRVNYSLTCRVEGTKSALVENLEHTRRFTVLIPEVVPAIED